MACGLRGARDAVGPVRTLGAGKAVATQPLWAPMGARKGGNGRWGCGEAVAVGCSGIQTRCLWARGRSTGVCRVGYSTQTVRSHMRMGVVMQ